MNRYKEMQARFPGRCAFCPNPIALNDPIAYYFADRTAAHIDCAKADDEAHAAERAAQEAAQAEALKASKAAQRKMAAARAAERAAMPVTDAQRRAGCDEINSTTCSRCGGSGHYSFNLMTGSTCFKCQGIGRTRIAPKGQPKVAVTAERNAAKVGDIIDSSGSLYRVDRIVWAHRISGYAGPIAITDNQKLICTRLIDGKQFGVYRNVANPDCRVPDAPKAIRGTDAAQDEAGFWIIPAEAAAEA